MKLWQHDEDIIGVTFWWYGSFLDHGEPQTNNLGIGYVAVIHFRETDGVKGCPLMLRNIIIATNDGWLTGFCWLGEDRDTIQSKKLHQWIGPRENSAGKPFIYIWRGNHGFRLRFSLKPFHGSNKLSGWHILFRLFLELLPPVVEVSWRVDSLNFDQWHWWCHTLIPWSFHYV